MLAGKAAGGGSGARVLADAYVAMERLWLPRQRAQRKSKRYLRLNMT